MLADLIGVNSGTIARWERGAQTIRQRNEAALAEALGVGLQVIQGSAEDAVPEHQDQPTERDLRTIDFVTWLAAHSDRSFAEAYQAVATKADQIAAKSKATKHAKNHERAVVSRHDITAAVASYYGFPDDNHQLYTVGVDGREIVLPILIKPGWTGLNVDLLGGDETATLINAEPNRVTLDEVVFDAAVTRLADAEVNNRVLINNPLYRLLSVNVEGGRLRTEFGMAGFADYALRGGLMEVELVDQLGESAASGEPSVKTPIRDTLLPTVDAALDFPSRFCTGGPVALLAVARPADIGRPADYALFIQARGSQVMDIEGKLSTVPKGWHQPIGATAPETRLGTTLLRELEEELFGRQDLEQMSDEARRTADPLHDQRRPEAVQVLINGDAGFQAICTGFGINLVSGTYEVPCLMVIEDETWWQKWGHLIVGNWETSRIDCYSSMDAEGLSLYSHSRSPLE